MQHSRMDLQFRWQRSAGNHRHFPAPQASGMSDMAQLTNWGTYKAWLCSGTNIPAAALYPKGLPRRAPLPRLGIKRAVQTGKAPMEASASRSRNIRVALVGVGNCASSFVQGLTYYRDVDGNEPIPGLMNVELGGYRARDIQISAAFDI